MARKMRGKNKDNARRSKKTSPLTEEQVVYVDYKDVNLLRRFMSDRAKIRARRVTGNDAQQQKEVARAIKARGRWRSCPTPSGSPPLRTRDRGSGVRADAPMPRQRRRRPQPLVGPRARRFCPMSWWATAKASRSLSPRPPLCT